MKRPLLNTLTNRISISISLVLVCLLVFLLLGVNSAVNDYAKVDKQRMASELQDLLNTTLATPLFIQDFASVQDILNQIRSKQPNLLYLQVTDGFEYKAGSFGQQALQTYLQDNPKADKVIQPVEIKLEGETVGYAHFYFKLEFYKTLKNNLDNQILLFIVLAMMISIGLTTVITRFLTKGLKTLRQSSQRIAEGDYQTPVSQTTSGDIGELAKTIEQMRLSVLHRSHELEAEQARLFSLLNTLKQAILFETSNQEIKYFNTAFLNMCRLSEQEMTAQSGLSLNDLIHSSNMTCNAINYIDENSHADKKELHLVDGRIIIQTHLFVDHATQETGHLWVFEDVTEERLMQTELEQLASYDSLTGLHNRHYYNAQIAKMAAFAKRHHQLLAMLYFDIDEFKVVNDTYGHPEGDQVLIRIAHELQSIVRTEEVLCRIGGDEFTVLLLVQEKDEAKVLAKRIVEGLASIRHVIGGEVLRLTTSLGISYYPDPSISHELLATHSDIAMYEAKKRGKNSYQVYDSDPKTLKTEQQRLSWKDKIEEALTHGLFELHFQSIFYSYDCHKISHLEALIRLKDAALPTELIYPDQFIPIAEKTGQIMAIDRWVIEESIRILAHHPDIPAIAINLSGKSFDDPSLPDFIKGQIEHRHISPKRLLIELTETETVQDIHDAERFIHALQAIGCDVALDDFGTGFASFSYLKHLPVDILKIDGTFIRDLANSYENRLFVQSMVMVAKGLGKRTVAEFVENAEVQEACKSLGVDLLQGYHLSRPSKSIPLILNSQQEKQHED